VDSLEELRDEAELVEDTEVPVDEEPLADAEDDPELVDVAELALRDETGEAIEVEELIVLLAEEVMVLFIERVTELRNTPL
jgi:hypothetical protein